MPYLCQRSAVAPLTLQILHTSYFCNPWRSKIFLSWSGFILVFFIDVSYHSRASFCQQIKFKLFLVSSLFLPSLLLICFAGCYIQWPASASGNIFYFRCRWASPCSTGIDSILVLYMFSCCCPHCRRQAAFFSDFCPHHFINPLVKKEIYPSDILRLPNSPRTPFTLFQRPRPPINLCK